MSRKIVVKNYSKRHENERITPQNQCRTYYPSEARGMASGVPITSYKVDSNPEPRLRGFAYESTKRVHID